MLSKFLLYLPLHFSLNFNHIFFLSWFLLLFFSLPNMDIYWPKLDCLVNNGQFRHGFIIPSLMVHCLLLSWGLSASQLRSWYLSTGLLEIIWGQDPMDCPIAFLPDPDPYKVKVQFAALMTPLRSSYLLNSLSYSLCNMILWNWVLAPLTWTNWLYHGFKQSLWLDQRSRALLSFSVNTIFITVFQTALSLYQEKVKHILSLWSSLHITKSINNLLSF